MTDPVYGHAEVLEVSVPVTTMWTSAQAPRDIDSPAVLAAPDVAAWTASMDAVVRRGLVGRTLTQLLLGEPVHVLEHAGEWVRVAALWQPSSAHPSGYPGWVRRAHLAVPSARTGLRAVVIAPMAPLRGADGSRSWVSFGTSLPSAAETPVTEGGGGGAMVSVPGEDAPASLPANGVRLVPDGERTTLGAPTSERMLESASMFVGLRYLWGGTSAWGLDCSGLVHLTLRAHGLELPRDAFDQAEWVQPVDLDAVRPGDLYFFARPGERVYHVGFVSQPLGPDGVRRMLHAPEGGELIEEAPLAPHRVETLVSAGRIQGR